MDALLADSGGFPDDMPGLGDGLLFLIMSLVCTPLSIVLAAWIAATVAETRQEQDGRGLNVRYYLGSFAGGIGLLWLAWSARSLWSGFVPFTLFPVFLLLCCCIGSVIGAKIAAASWWIGSNSLPGEHDPNGD